MQNRDGWRNEFKAIRFKVEEASLPYLQPGWEGDRCSNAASLIGPFSDIPLQFRFNREKEDEKKDRRKEKEGEEKVILSRPFYFVLRANSWKS